MKNLGNYVALPEQGQAEHQLQQLPAFTPGPWSLYYEGSIYAEAKNTGRKFDEHICGFRWSSFKEFNDSPEDKANARLIAAAPDMYAAMKEIEWIFDGKEDITDNGGPNDAMRALATVRAALRKARGER